MTLIQTDVQPEVAYGRVTGYFVSYLADSTDAGTIPDEIPLTGTVLLTPLTSVTRWPTTTPPRLAIGKQATCPVVNGYLCTPGSAIHDVWLVATDQPEGQPDVIQWKASFRFDGVTVQPADVVFNVPAGGVVDLALVADVPPAPGTIVVVSHQDALDAAASADAAAASADAAADTAAELDDGIAAEVAAQITAANIPGQVAASNSNKVDKGTLVIDAMNAPYNAVGNGAADDTSAIQAALTAANAAKGATVLLRGTHKITSALVCSGFKDVEIKGNTRARTTGSGLLWAGADNGVAIKADNAEGFVVSGLLFSSNSATFAGSFIDFSNASVTPQAFHILIEWCCFIGGGGALHTDIRCGGGHNCMIRFYDFYRSNIAIQGREMSFTPQQGMNTVLIERNWFEANRTTAHIVNPHTTWKITNNAVEPLTGGSAGFIKLVGGAKLNAVTIDSNWCGDVTAAGAQIEVAGGPFRIVGNLLQTSTGGAAIKAVGVIDRGCSIEDNSIISSTFIDWGAFTHAPLSGSPSMGGYRVLGNEIVGATVASAGTAPAKLFSDLAGCLSFIRPGMLTIDAAAVGGVVAIDASIHREAVFIYLNANVTAMTITNPTYVGQKLTILLRQSTAGTSTFVWPASFHFPGGAGPACSGAFNQTTLTVMWDSASARWVEISRAVNIT